MKRRHFLILSSAALLSGCSTWHLPPWNSHTVRSQSPEEPAADEGPARLVGDLAVPFGMFPVKVEAVGLISGLHGTGSDPEPSPQRGRLLDEMKKHDVKNPNALLASRNYSLVLVRAVLRPGIQKGDRFDVEVRIPSRSETTSLRGGYLLPTRLSDMAVLEGMQYDGKERATAEGPVLVDPAATEQTDRVLLGRGRILGGAVSLQSRSLGLVLNSGEETNNMTPAQLRNSVVKSALVMNAINRRFHTFSKGIKVGVATAKTGKYVDLTIHPRYKDNVDRYMRVVRAVALRETTSELSQRITDLEKQLLDPTAAAQAALELEAIGKLGVDTLLRGIQSNDREVKFYAAEALAYLDRREAAEPLAEIARREPALRMSSLIALSSMRDDYTAYEQLRDLLAVPSAETRYGAFRALWTMNPSDSLVKGELLGRQFSYHVLDTQGEAMIHVTRNRRAEVVLFGQKQKFLTPFSINAGPRIMVTSSGGDEVSVARFAPNEADQKRTVPCKVDDVVRAIVELGGTYPDVVQAFQEAKAAKVLEGRFEVDALPWGDRELDRDSPEEGSGESVAADEEAAEKLENAGDSGKKRRPVRDFFARMVGKGEKPAAEGNETAAPAKGE